jgi:diguanylate cyclase (GGDEF)-like protein/PAS domain S-box-containing protein
VTDAPATVGPAVDVRAFLRVGSRAVVALLAVLAVLVVVLRLGLPAAAVQLTSAVLAVGSAATAVALVRAARRLPDGSGRPWRAFAAVGVLIAIGQAGTAARGVGGGVGGAGWEEVPTALSVAVAVVACLLLLPRRPGDRLGSRVLVDALIVLVAVALLAEFVLADALVTGEGLAAAMITVGYPALGAVLCGLGLVVLARVGDQRRRSAAWVLCALALMSVVAVADAFGRTLGGPVTDLLTPLAWLGMLAAILRAADADPGRTETATAPSAPVPLLGVLLSQCAAYSVVILFVGVAVAGRRPTVVEAVGVGALVLLTFVRGLLWATDGQRLARRLLRTDRRMRAMVSSAEDVTVVLDVSGTVTWVSGGVSRQLGWSGDDLTGRPLGRVLDDDGRAALRRLVEHLTGTGAGDGPVALPLTLGLRTREGQRRDVEVAAAARLAADGAPDDEVVLHLRDVTARRSTERELERMAWTDYLTGLPNRARLMAALEAARARSAEGDPGCVLLIDLDGFKTVNDVAGHEAGDRLLTEVADRLRTAARERDLVARLGGDEFALVVPGTPAEATGLAERLVALLDRPFRAPAPDGTSGPGPLFAVTGSIGVAQLLPSEDATAAIRAADLALRAAKAAGKSCYRFTGPGRDGALGQAMRRRARLARDLPAALEHGQLRLEYQPVAGLRERRVLGLEALVRWDHPVLGTVPPDEFIALAEDDGLIVPLQQWVLRTATADLSVLLAQGRDLKLGVNVSVRHLQAGCLAPDVARSLAAAGVPPQRLMLEITESVLVDAQDRLEGDLVTLRDMGCIISLDDFGKGFSSLAYLSRLPVDVLKMDREFVAGIDGDERAEALVRTVVELGQRLGMDVVAEGVETIGQLTCLDRLGCDFVQGWLVGRPVPADRLPRVIDAFDPTVLDGREADEAADDPTERLADVH